MLLRHIIQHGSGIGGDSIRNSVRSTEKSMKCLDPHDVYLCVSTTHAPCIFSDFSVQVAKTFCFSTSSLVPLCSSNFNI